MTTVTPPTPTADAIAEPWASEQTITCRDDRVGLRAVIAIDDTTLGPGFGGVRYRAYPSTEAAAREARTALSPRAFVEEAQKFVPDLDPATVPLLVYR